jgi:hypothetical protein
LRGWIEQPGAGIAGLTNWAVVPSRRYDNHDIAFITPPPIAVMRR